jgi:hypothetical protein
MTDVFCTLTSGSSISRVFLALQGRSEGHSRRASRCEIAERDAGAAGPSEPAPGRHEAIDAQIGNEIAVMQGVVISDLRQDEHLVRLEAKEVRGVIEVRIGEPGEGAIAVIERAFEVGNDLSLRNFRGWRGGVRCTLGV